MWDRTFAFSPHDLLYTYIENPGTGKSTLLSHLLYTYIGHPGTGKFALLSHLVYTNIRHPGTGNFPLLHVSHLLYTYIVHPGTGKLHCYHICLHIHWTPRTGKYTLLSHLLYTYIGHPGTGRFALPSHLLYYTYIGHPGTGKFTLLPHLLYTYWTPWDRSLHCYRICFTHTLDTLGRRVLHCYISHLLYTNIGHPAVLGQESLHCYLICFTYIGHPETG